MNRSPGSHKGPSPSSSSDPDPDPDFELVLLPDMRGFLGPSGTPVPVPAICWEFGSHRRHSLRRLLDRKRHNTNISSTNDVNDNKQDERKNTEAAYYY